MNPLVQAFGSEKRWVNWKLDPRKGKVPYGTDGSHASSNDPETWSTYEDAAAATPNVGIMFGDGSDLLGIDIDHCLEAGTVVHERADDIIALVAEANTYAEVSPSGTGLHLYLRLSAPLKLEASKKAPFEAYTALRYFTVTENPYGEQRAVRTVTPGEALFLLGMVGYPWKKTKAMPERQTHALDDDAVLRKMFAAKNGAKVRETWDARPGADESGEDMSLCGALAFWTGRNPTQMERLWMSSPLGSRGKTQERKDYRDRTIAAAIASCAECYEPKAAKVERENPDLDLLFALNAKKDVVYTLNLENVCRILRRHPDFAGRCVYDEYRLEYRYGGEAFDSVTALGVQSRISILFPFFGKVGKEMVYDAMVMVARENRVDSAVDALKSLEWDGTSRLDSWLTHVYGVTDNAYHRAVGSNYLKGMVKRIVDPGCKFDYVLALEGPQGTKKSTSLGVLAGPFGHVETTMSTDSKDFFMQFQGKAIVEFAEGETLSRTEVKKMKAIITTQVDKFRPPYERTSQDFKRRCVFAMTTNNEEYLKDETGNRRWLPVTVILPEANVEWLAGNRDQLFAEAYARVITDGETVHEFPKEETSAEQDSRRIHDPNADLIADWYMGSLTREERRYGVTVTQVHSQAMQGGLGSKSISRSEEMSIADVLKNHLKLIKRHVMVGGVRKWRWYSPTEPEGVETSEEIMSSLESWN